MSYRDFDLATVQERFGIQTDHSRALFESIQPVKLSTWLEGYLENVLPWGLGLTSGTEKARSELLVSPLLTEVWLRSQRRIVVYSGLEMNVDAKLGLNGVCDFVLGESKQAYVIEAPVLAVVEAKRESIIDGLGQCIAEMIAARMLNESKHKPTQVMHGCITTGITWKILRLTGTQLEIDVNEYSITQADRIVGILMHCCGVTV